MKIVQQKQFFTLAEVHFAEVLLKCVSSKIKPIKSMTYLLKLIAEVHCIPVRGIEDMRSLWSRISFSDACVEV